MKSENKGIINTQTLNLSIPGLYLRVDQAILSQHEHLSLTGATKKENSLRPEEVFILFSGIIL